MQQFTGVRLRVMDRFRVSFVFLLANDVTDVIALIHYIIYSSPLARVDKR